MYDFLRLVRFMATKPEARETSIESHDLFYTVGVLLLFSYVGQKNKKMTSHDIIYIPFIVNIWTEVMNETQTHEKLLSKNTKKKQKQKQ